MKRNQKISLVILRITMGWIMFYAGITKLLNPEWSAAGYLHNAQSFTGLFEWLTQPALLPIVNSLNEWGLTLLGISLLLGIFVRLSSVLGIVLMVLYYLPILNFPYAGKHSFLIDEHIIYAIILYIFAVMHCGRFYGVDRYIRKYKFFRKNKTLRNILT